MPPGSPRARRLFVLHTPPLILRFLFTLVAVAAIAILAQPPRLPVRTEDGPILPRRELLNALGASQRSLLADYYWLQCIQQTGRARTESEYRDIYFYADLATGLDPRFRYAYEWGAVATPFNRGREQWVNGDLSARLLRKGLAHFPGDWSLTFQLGFNLMTYAKDYRGAADAFMSLANDSQTPAYVPQLATRLYAQSGDFNVSRQATAMMRDMAADEQSRAFYERRLFEIDREELLTRIDTAAEQFEARSGRKPASVAALQEAGLLEGLPPDPLGGEYFLDLNGRARATSGAYRLENYTNPKKQALRESLPDDLR